MDVPLFSIILLILFGITASFLSSIISELSQERLNYLIDSNYKKGQILQNLRLQFEYNISPFQIIEVISYSVAGIIFGKYIIFFEEFYLIKAVLTFSFSILVFRYILQAYGIRYANYLASPLSSILYLYYIISLPFFYVLYYITKRIVGNINESSLEEIDNMVETAYSEKSIERDEYKLLKNSIGFGDVSAKDVMTPRSVIFSLNLNTTVGDIIKMPEILNYSRIPIWEGESIDDGVTGYVLTREILFAAVNEKKDTTLGEHLQEATYILETDKLDDILVRFLNKRQHLFMVVDEYGSVAGLITMEDVVETILGEEIVDEVDKIVDLRQLAKQKIKDKLSIVADEENTDL